MEKKYFELLAPEDRDKRKIEEWEKKGIHFSWELNDRKEFKDWDRRISDEKDHLRELVENVNEKLLSISCWLNSVDDILEWIGQYDFYTEDVLREHYKDCENGIVEAKFYLTKIKEMINRSLRYPTIKRDYTPGVRKSPVELVAEEIQRI